MSHSPVVLRTSYVEGLEGHSLVSRDEDPPSRVPSRVYTPFPTRGVRRGPLFSDPILDVSPVLVLGVFKGTLPLSGPRCKGPLRGQESTGEVQDPLVSPSTETYKDSATSNL